MLRSDRHVGALDGGVPKSRVEFKKRPCRMSLSLEKRPCHMSIVKDSPVACH